MQIKSDESDVKWSLISKCWVRNKVEAQKKQKTGKTQSCLSCFVYHYSNNLAAPDMSVWLISSPFSPIPDLINLDPNGNKCNNIPLFPPTLTLWTGSPSRHFSPLNPLCNLKLPVAFVSQVLHWNNSKSKWTLSKASLSVLITTPRLSLLHNRRKLSKSHSSEHVLIIQAPGVAHSSANLNSRPVVCPVQSLRERLMCSRYQELCCR